MLWCPPPPLQTSDRFQNRRGGDSKVQTVTLAMSSKERGATQLWAWQRLKLLGRPPKPVFGRPVSFQNWLLQHLLCTKPEKNYAVTKGSPLCARCIERKHEHGRPGGGGVSPSTGHRPIAREYWLLDGEVGRITPWNSNFSQVICPDVQIYHWDLCHSQGATRSFDLYHSVSSPVVWPQSLR